MTDGLGESAGAASSEARPEDDIACVVGEIIGECADCCTAKTGGDMCARCNRVAAILLRELKSYGRERERAALERAAKALETVAVESDDWADRTTVQDNRINWRRDAKVYRDAARQVRALLGAE